MTPDETVKYLNDMVAESQQHFEPCLLCKVPTQGRGLFFPKKSHEWGERAGKKRFFMYAICDVHGPLINGIDQQIEDEIRRRLNSGEMDIMTSA